MNEAMAISLLKAYVDLYRRMDLDKRYLTKQGLECIETVLDLVDKQQKEIEELKKPKYIIDCKTNEITKLTNDFISKDKIKTKINDLRFLLYSFEKERDEKLVCDSEESINCLLGQISILNSLLEEN